MTNELKPCPLGCPRSHINVYTRKITSEHFEAKLQCNKCDINIFRSGETEKLALENAIEAWNTRAERTCKPIPKYGDDSPWPVMVCSECGRPLHYDELREMDYPPYCGCGAKVVE